MLKPWREAGLLIVICAVVYLTRLGATHFWDDDEGYFAQTACEMFDRGDIVVPWFNDELFSHKPPFMYWLMMAGYGVFGVGEFAARFPSSLFGCATVLLVWRLGRRLYSPRVGLWAAVVLATSLNFVVISRAATADAELAFFCTLPIYLVVRGAAARKSSDSRAGGDGFAAWQPGTGDLLANWRTLVGAYAAMGVAVLVKGPIGVLLPTSVLGLFLLLRHASVASTANATQGGRSQAPTRRPRAARALGAAAAFVARMFSPRTVLHTIWNLRPLTALALVLMVCGPWYAAVAWQTQGEFLRGFFGVHHFGRFTNPMDNHGGSPLYYFAVVCVGFFPWIIFLGPSLAQWLARMRTGHAWRQADLLCAAWVAVWFGFFSLASTKFPHYVVPAYPALALVTAAFLDRWLILPAVYPTVQRRIAWITVAVVGAGLMVALPFVGRLYLGESTSAWAAGAPLFVAAVAAAIFSERGRIARSLASLSTGTVAFLLLLFGQAAVEVDRHQNTPAIGALIRANSASATPRIATYRFFRPSLVHYAPQPVERFYETSDAIEFFRSNAHDVYLVVHGRGYDQLGPSLPDDTRILYQEPWFMKAGQSVLVLGRSPSTSSVEATPTTASAPAHDQR